MTAAPFLSLIAASSDPDTAAAIAPGLIALQIASGVLLIGGGLFSIIGGIGILRLPEFYSRTHGGGVTDTAGAILTIVGLMLVSGSWLVAIKLAMILFFMFVASPSSSHALTKSALSWGIKPELEQGETVYSENAPTPTAIEQRPALDHVALRGDDSQTDQDAGQGAGGNA